MGSGGLLTHVGGPCSHCVTHDEGGRLWFELGAFASRRDGTVSEMVLSDKGREITVEPCGLRQQAGHVALAHTSSSSGFPPLG